MNEEIRFEDLKLSVIGLWKKKMLIIAITIIAFLIGVLVTSNKDIYNVYRAQSTVYSAIYGSYTESVAGTTAMISYADIVSSKKVCERAAALIGNFTITANEIQNMVSASYDSSSVILYVQAYSENPDIAIAVSNAVAEAFVIEVRSIVGTDAIQTLDSADNVTIFMNGANELLKNRIYFAFAGLALSCALFMGLELFSNKIKSIEQCTDDETDKILGIIPISD